MRDCGKFHTELINVAVMEEGEILGTTLLKGLRLFEDSVIHQRFLSDNCWLSFQFSFCVSFFLFLVSYLYGGSFSIYLCGLQVVEVTQKLSRSSGWRPHSPQPNKTKDISHRHFYEENRDGRRMERAVPVHSPGLYRLLAHRY